MKYIKIFTLAAALFGVVACSDDKKEYNTASEVTVEMADPSLTVKENTGIFNVPLKLNGTPNGVVTVKVEVKESGVNSAKEAAIVDGKRVGNYIVTSKTINIPADEKTANIQINAIDDDDENEDRTFDITIISAEGARIDESKKTTIVTIKDNDKVPYEKLQGAWSLSWEDLNTGSVVSCDVNITGAEEGKPNYDRVLVIEDLLTIPDEIIKAGDSKLKLNYFYNEATDECYVELDYGQMFGPGNSSLYPSLVNSQFYFYGLTIQGEYLNLVEDGYMTGEVSADRKLIAFPAEDLIGLCYTTSDGLMLYGAGYSLTLTRK